MKIFLLLSILASPFAHADYDPTNDLILAFGSNCSTRGELSANAAADANALKGIIDSIRNDPDCADVTSILANIQERLSSLQVDMSDAKSDVGQLSETVAEMEFVLKRESSKPNPDSDILEGIKEELIETRLDLAKAKSIPGKIKYQSRVEGTLEIQSHVTALFARLQNNNRCNSKTHPNLAGQIGAIALSAASAFNPGIMGAMLLGAGNIVDNFVTFMRDVQIKGNLDTIESPRVGGAVGCALEGVAQTYCEARDADQLVQQNIVARENISACEAEWQGIPLVSQDIRAISDWLEKVSAGSSPSSKAQAEEKLSAMKLKSGLDNARITIDGILAQGRRKWTVAEKKDQVLKGIAMDLASTISSYTASSRSSYSSESTPVFNDFFGSDDCGPWIYLLSNGQGRSSSIIPAGDYCSSYMNKMQVRLTTIDDLDLLVKDMYVQTERDIALSAALVKEDNPQLILSQAFEPNALQSSPYQFLINARNYLQYLRVEVQSRPNGHQLGALIDHLLPRISRSIETLDTAPENSSAALTNIAFELAPDNNRFYLPNAINAIVQQDIRYKVQEGKVDEPLQVLWSLSQSDSLGTLIRTYVGVDRALAQTQEGKRTSIKNLEALGEMFAKQLRWNLNDLSKQDAAILPESQSILGLQCVRALLIPHAIDDGDLDLKKFCKGKSYKTSLPGSTLQLSFDEISKKPYPEQVCSIYDFFRESKYQGLKAR